ncbi:MAG: hypothetical protein V1784_06595, partial [bacterium]
NEEIPVYCGETAKHILDAVQASSKRDIEGEVIDLYTRFGPNIYGTDIEASLKPHVSNAEVSGSYLSDSLSRSQRAIEETKSLSYNTTASFHAMGTVITDEAIIHPQFFGGRDAAGNVVREFRKIDITPQQEILDSLLREYGVEFVQMRKQAWNDFNRGAPANVENAAHQMRELLTRLLNQKASTEPVTQAKWFDPKEHLHTKNQAKRWAQIKYFIMGNDESKVSHEELSYIGDLSESIADKHNELSSKAHGKSMDRDRVRTLLIEYEVLLLKMLQAKKKHDLSR